MKHSKPLIIVGGLAAYFAYATLSSTLGGPEPQFTPINPIKALYWSAVINGVVSVPVMAVMMMMTGRAQVMGKFTVRGGLRQLGWATTGVMAACVAAMVLTWIV